MAGDSPLWPRSSRAARAAAFVASALLAGVLALLPAQTAAAANDGGLLSILVMGDSYSAGNGAGAYYGAKGCRRSSRNYAREYARLVEKAPYRQRTFVENVACSGDRTGAIFTPHNGRPRQVGAVNPGYDVVFLTIGGNDLHFGEIVEHCLLRGRASVAHCGPLLTNAEQRLDDGTMEQALTRVLLAIQRRADRRARIVLLGYPYLEGDAGYRLRAGRKTVEVGRRLRAITDAGDRLQDRVVRRLNREHHTRRFVFVSTKRLFAGPPDHSLFAMRSNPRRWFVQPFVDRLLIEGPADWYHPSPTGWKKEAELLLRNSRVPKRDLNTDPGPTPMPAPPGPGGGSGSLWEPAGGGDASGSPPESWDGAGGTGGGLPPGTWIAVAAAWNHTCGVRSTGAVYCWGRDEVGQLGDDALAGGESASPVQVSGVSGATSVATGPWHSCAVTDQGNVMCWGLPGWTGTGVASGSTATVTVPGITDAVRIAAGNYQTCALRSTGEVACWGYIDGEALTPAPLGDLDDVTSIDAKHLSACATLTTGALVCWYPYDADPTPEPIPGVAGAIDVAVGAFHTCVVHSTSQVSCWGSNTKGQLGNGTTESSGVPVVVSGLDDAVAVDAGSDSTCALRATGQVVCWGDNERGQFGDGTQGSATVPSVVQGVDDATGLSHSGLHGCALREGGALSCWGFNYWGQVGDGTNRNIKLSPIPVG